MGNFTFWRTPEWYARRDARGNTLGHARINRYVVVKPSVSSHTVTDSDQVTPDLSAGASAEPIQPVAHANPRS